MRKKYHLVLIHYCIYKQFSHLCCNSELDRAILFINTPFTHGTSAPPLYDHKTGQVTVEGTEEVNSLSYLLRSIWGWVWQLTNFSCDVCEDMCTLSYYRHEIESVNRLPLVTFRPPIFTIYYGHSVAFCSCNYSPMPILQRRFN